MAMTNSVRQALSPALFAFFDYLRTAGHEAPSKVTAEVIADLFRQFFGIPCPMVPHDASSLLQRFRYNNVFLQPGLERHKHIRGFWGVQHNKVLILLEATRPDPSKIKSLLHEIAEMLLKIDYDSNKQAYELSDKEREKWANSFAAMVKMPREVFLPAVEMYGIDLPLLSEIFCETLAGISRHIRDLYMPDRAFYFGRVSLEHDPERKCSDLLPCLEQSGGVCVYVADAAKTKFVSTHRRHGGALPVHNVGKKAQFRVMHPRLRLYEEEENPKDAAPIYISRLRAASGFGSSQLELDLLRSQDLAVLIYPIATRRRLSGFFVVAVHYEDVCLFDKLRENKIVSRQDDMDWVFSWEKEEYARAPDDDLDEYLSGQPTLDLFDDEDAANQRVRWLVDPD